MLFWLIPLALLTARLVWQKIPGLATCALFWGLAAVALLQDFSLGLPELALGVGIVCNAAVTLANGGFMPVAAHRRRAGPARSLWVQRQSTHRLLFLADNFGNRFVRFSVGDVFLLVGIVLSLVLP